MLRELFRIPPVSVDFFLGDAESLHLLGDPIRKLVVFFRAVDEVESHHPFAAGNLPLSWGAGMAGIALLAGCACFGFAGTGLAMLAAGFLAVSLARTGFCRGGTRVGAALGAVLVVLRLAIGGIAAGLLPALG